jgi:hypothetical protein
MNKTIVNITTFQRNEMVVELLKHIPSHVDVIVWDDDPENDFDFGTTFQHRFQINHGKKMLWKKFETIFNWNKVSGYDHFIFLPDDVVPVDDWLNTAFEIWNLIKHPQKISLSLLVDQRGHLQQWTFTDVKDCGKYVLTGWNDLCFICDQKYLDQIDIQMIDPARWNVDPNLSSGVGSMISNQMFDLGFHQYHVKNTLFKHVGTDSKMNPVERLKNPL